MTFNSGGLFAAAELGGAFNDGTIFELGPLGGAPLYSFAAQADGAAPNGGLVFDTAGNLYGTALGGGINANCRGCGTLFKGIPPAAPGGPWGGALLWSFTGGADGTHPGPLIFDAAGTALYGTTDFAGAATGWGTVFKLTP